MTALAIVLAVVAPARPSPAQATDPMSGTWELNLAKSKYTPGPPPRSATRTLEVTGQGEKSTSKGVGADGKPTLTQSAPNYDGTDYPLTGSATADTTALRRIDALTLEFTQKKAGKVVSTGTRAVSKDGKVLTVTSKGTNVQGQPTSSVAVYDKK